MIEAIKVFSILIPALLLAAWGIPRFIDWITTPMQWERQLEIHEGKHRE